MLRLYWVIACVLTLTVGQAKASVVLSDNFDTEAGGATVLNYDGFANFAGLFGPPGSNRFNLIGPGITGSGSLVELVGPYSVLGTKNTYAIKAGETVTLTFSARGNPFAPIDNPSQVIFAGFEFTSPIAYDYLSSSGGFPQEGGHPDSGGFSPGFDAITSISSNSPWTSYLVTFHALADTGLIAFIGGTEPTGDGPLIDNVELTITPLPAALPLFVTGLGMMGFLAKRRQRKPAAQTAP